MENSDNGLVESNTGYQLNQLQHQILSMLELNSTSSLAAEEVYSTYAEQCFSQACAPIEKIPFGKFLHSLYPDVKTTRERIDSGSALFRVVHKGLGWTSALPSNDNDKITPLTEIIVTAVKDSTIPYFIKSTCIKLPSTEECVELLWPSEYSINDIDIYKAVRFERHKWTMQIGGKEVNLSSIGISDKFFPCKHDVMLALRQAHSIRLCTGKKICGNHARQEKCSDISSGKIYNILRSSTCQGVLSYTSSGTTNTCRSCQVNCKSIENKENMPEATSDSLIDTIKAIIPNAPDSMITLIQSQSENMAKESPMARRWSKEMISFCLSIWSTSPRAYRHLSDFNHLLLPSERLLQYYKNIVHQSPGFLEDMFQWMYQEAVRLGLPPHGYEGGIIVDEMKIQEDLQMARKGSEMMLYGFKDVGIEGQNMDILKNGQQSQSMANHVLQFQFLGFTGFRFPFAHFATTQASPAELYTTVWEAVMHLERYHFKPLYINMDGASTNRSFMKMHIDMKASMATINIVNQNLPMFMIMDVSHVVKKIRNNISKSGDGNGCTRKLTLPSGQYVTWKKWVAAYEWDLYNPVRIHHKLTHDHVNLTSESKMRNSLAEQVLDCDMLRLMQEYKETVGEDVEDVDGCIELLLHTSKLIANFRDARPISDLGDKRLCVNEDILAWFSNWETEVMKKEGVTETAKSRQLISYQTREDIHSAITGFQQLVEHQLLRRPGTSITASRLNSDVLENQFCQQRGIKNGAAQNPNYLTYSRSINSIILTESSVSKKSNAARPSGKPFTFTTRRALNPAKSSITSTYKVKKIRV